MRPTVHNVQLQALNHFNPRTPYGMRPILLDGVRSECEISIHAPLTGCDQTARVSSAKSLYFNPRTPYGMRLDKWLPALTSGKISIHAPLTGCDNIEIHSKQNRKYYFNPRTPYGMRQA